MKNILKYGVVPFVVFVFLLSCTIMLLPTLIDVQSFVPQIEKQISKVTGREFNINSNFDVTFFPFVSITCSDVHLGNPKGFPEGDFIKMDSFEARVRFLPLFKKELHFSRFVMGGVEVNLEKLGDGRINWDFRDLFKTKQGNRSLAKELPGWITPNDLTVKLFAVTDGAVNWYDHKANDKRKAGEITLLAKHLKQQKPSFIEFAGTFNGRKVAADGTIGPFKGGQNFFDVIPADLMLTLDKTTQIGLKGEFLDLIEKPSYVLNLEAEGFQLPYFFHVLAADDLSTESSNSAGVTLAGQLQGDTKQFSFTGKDVKFGHSTLQLTVNMADIKTQEVEVGAEFDNFALDKFLHNLGEASQASTDIPQAYLADTINYSGIIQGDSITYGQLTAQNVVIKIKGKGQDFTLDPVTAELGGGTVAMTLNHLVQNGTQKTDTSISLQGVEAGDALPAAFNKKIVTGTADMELHLLKSSVTGNMLEGTDAASGRESELKGTITIANGSVPEINLLGADEKNKDIPEADSVIAETETVFTELSGDVSVADGKMKIDSGQLIDGDTEYTLTGDVDFGEKLAKLTLLLVEEGDAKLTTSPVILDFSGETLQRVAAETGVVIEPELELPGKDASSLVEEKLPSPVEDDVKGLVGKVLVDPAIVVQRFRLKPEIIEKDKVKKHFKIGSGKVQIGSLTHEETLR